LLARQDKPAFRTRAFALAIAGDVEGAVGIANASLPQGVAAGIAPYLRYMPRLTRAQQAAAANFGHFPRASEIGRDDPRIARYTAAADAAAAQVARADTQGAGGRTGGKGSHGRQGVQVAAAAPPPSAPPEAPRVSREVSASGIGGRPAAQPVPVAATPARPVAVPAVATVPGAVMGPVLAADGAASRPSPETVPAPPPSSPAPVQPVRPRSVADAFGDFSGPVPEVVPAAGAVDIRKITPARARPREEAVPVKPAPPSHPSRIWVQVAAGRNKDALAFDWRRMVREAPEQFRGKKANVSASGQSNRLLAGPFPSEAAATAFIAQLRRVKIDDAFIWTSPAGQVVDVLATP
jgi:hypothetical protein